MAGCGTFFKAVGTWHEILGWDLEGGSDIYSFLGMEGMIISLVCCLVIPSLQLSRVHLSTNEMFLHDCVPSFHRPSQLGLFKYP